VDEKCIPPKMLETRRHYIDKAIEASHALQAGLITGSEWDAIADLAIDWNNYVKWLLREEETQRLDAALERLTSNGPAIIEGLRQAGYHSLALQDERDIEALVERGA